MKTLWILKPVKHRNRGDDPWHPWFDKVFGFVVRATSEEEARKFAHKEAGAENGKRFLYRKPSRTNAPWLDAKYSDCLPLADDGEIGVVLKDFRSAD